MLRDTNLHKLVTKEDPIHVHKILGTCSLLNFIYRYYLLICHGSMFLDTPTDLALIGIHGLLSISSLIFHIPSRRHKSLPLIYPEIRLHSICFGLRSIICCFIDYYGGAYKLYYKMGVCFGTMIVADLITMKVAEPGNTTMRDMPFSEYISEEDKRTIIQFHSNSQGAATISMLFNIDSAFSPLFAIQIAMFLMTMARKSIIKTNTWQLVYSLSLIINIFIYYTLSFSQIIILAIGASIFPFLRIQMRINKYVVWSIIFGFICLFNSYDLQFINNFKYANIIIYSIMYYYLISSMYHIRSLYMPLLLEKEI
jgi:hypothetical protein